MSLIGNEDFQHILCVLNMNVDGKKKIIFTLTSIKGGGRRFANIVCKKADVDMNKSTNKLGFTPEFLGRIKLVTSMASLVSVGLYNAFLKNVPLRKIFLGTTIIGSALGMTQVFLVTGLNQEFGISDEWFSLGDSLIITVLSQVIVAYFVCKVVLYFVKLYRKSYWRKLSLYLLFHFGICLYLFVLKSALLSNTSEFYLFRTRLPCY